MTSARDFGRAVKPGGDLWKLRRKPGGDVYQYRAALRERANIAFAAWRASGYRDGAAHARGMAASEAGYVSLAADRAHDTLTSG